MFFQRLDVFAFSSLVLLALGVSIVSANTAEDRQKLYCSNEKINGFEVCVPLSVAEDIIPKRYMKRGKPVILNAPKFENAEVGVFVETGEIGVFVGDNQISAKGLNSAILKAIILSINAENFYDSVYVFMGPIQTIAGREFQKILSIPKRIQKKQQWESTDCICLAVLHRQQYYCSQEKISGFELCIPPSVSEDIIPTVFQSSSEEDSMKGGEPVILNTPHFENAEVGVFMATREIGVLFGADQISAKGLNSAILKALISSINTENFDHSVSIFMGPSQMIDGKEFRQMMSIPKTIPEEKQPESKDIIFVLNKRRVHWA